MNFFERWRDLSRSLRHLRSGFLPTGIGIGLQTGTNIRHCSKLLEF